MRDLPFISICIPVYKRIHFLGRLLDSIAVQEYKDFDVIITDDSPGSEVEIFVKKYEQKFTLTYVKNPVSLGTPENWNEAIRRASGQWIKIMHDDDWFTNAHSLNEFADAAMSNPGCFIFSNYTNVFEGSGKEEIVDQEMWRYKLFLKNPSILVAKNIIGPPSVTIHPNDKNLFYDKRLKWLVDIDFYIRRLKQNKPVHISSPIVNVGIGEEQVTTSVKNVATVEIPEQFILLGKEGIASLKNVLVYDYYWRFVRNFKIKSVDFFKNNGYHDEIPEVIKNIISFQKKLPKNLLSFGLCSKLLMYISYIKNKSKL